jgi:hypothetical protein
LALMYSSTIKKVIVTQLVSMWLPAMCLTEYLIPTSKWLNPQYKLGYLSV